MLDLYKIGERRTSGAFRVLVLEYRIPENLDVTSLGQFIQTANAQVSALKRQVADLQAQLAAVPAVPAISGDADDKAQISAFAATLGVSDPSASATTPAATAPSAIDRL